MAAKVIGMANVYFTLWDVSEPYKEYTSATSFYWKVDYWYRQNLSKNLEAAKAKLSGTDFAIDLELRGTKSYSERRGSLQNEAPSTQFAYGKYEGREICTCDDIWQLERLVEDFDQLWKLVTPLPDELMEKRKMICQRAVNARRRLVNLGLWVKCPTTYEKWDSENQVYLKYKRNYTTVKNAAFIEAKQKKEQTFGHYFIEGEKVTLKLKEVDSFRFETQFGVCYIVTYLDSEGRGFKYMGTSPPSFIDNQEFTAVKGTVAHDEYKGVKETKLKRISLVK